MRQNTRLRSIIHSACALSLVAGFAIGLYGTAFILSADIVYAAGGGGGGSGGAGSGSGGAGSGSGGAGAGSGGSGAGTGAGAGTGGSGAGTGAGTGTGGSGAGTGAGTGTGGSGTGAGAGAGTGGSGAGTGAGTGTGGSGAGTGAGTGTGGSSAGAGAGRGTGGGSTGTGGGSGSGVGLGGTGNGLGTGAGSTGRGAGSGGTGAGSAAGAAGGSAATGTGSSGIGPGSTGAAETSGSGGAGDGRGNPGLAGSAERGGGFFARLLRGIGLGGAEPSMRAAAGPPLPLVSTPSPGRAGGKTAFRPPVSLVDTPSAGRTGGNTAVRPALAPAPPKSAQAFRFNVGTSVFPTTGGVLTTEGVDGVDLVTVDERHHRVIHPAAFFEPHEGARYDRRAVERFWPIEIGKQVRFVETVGNQRWVHVMSAVRMENVAVPAGVFRAFVVERTMQSIGPGPRPVSTYTYWYAPDAGAIVKTQVPPVDGIRIRSTTEEADVLGHPLPRPAPPPSTGALP